MQQSNQAIGISPPPAGNDLPQPVADGAFVINLTASTTPVALTQPTHPELRRFTFFVSRRREDGRERFRLHMGYFRTQEDAERLLDIVREIYPAAWAGIAPGQRLRNAGNAVAPGAAAASTAAPPAAAVNTATATAHAVAAPVASTAAVQAAAVIHAVPARVGVPGNAVTPTAATRSVTPPAPMAAASPPKTVPAATKPAVQAPVAPAPPARAPVASAAPAVAPGDDQAVVTSMTSVRAAIASLDAAANAVANHRAAAPRVPELRAAAPGLSDSQVLRVLESPQANAAANGVNGSARRELTNFAVQLMWSVQPIDMAQVPALAIFSAYTLYGAEGNRDGRRWYGLRLGFFTDAVSAKQVAQYVRSEFSSVSVVPVTIRERERAMLAAAQVAPKPGPAASAPGSSGQFKLLDDKPGVTSATGTHKVLPVKPGGVAAGANGAARPTGKRVRQPPIAAKKNGAAKPHKKELSLEETLEILGASELQIDDGRSELINDSGVRHLRLEAPKSTGGSKLGRLINRLADRLSND